MAAPAIRWSSGRPSFAIEFTAAEKLKHRRWPDGPRNGGHSGWVCGFDGLPAVAAAVHPDRRSPPSRRSRDGGGGGRRPTAAPNLSAGEPRWNEVRGLAGPDGEKIAAQVLSAVRAVPGVPVPPPDQLGFCGVLGGMAVLELMDWPLAIAMGVGGAVLNRHLTHIEELEEELIDAAEPAKKPPAGKASARSHTATARKAPPRKATSSKAG